jgi:hypothetical protein
MRDELRDATESNGTTLFLRNEPWFSRMRMLRLVYMLAIGAVVALVLWLVQSKGPTITPVQDAPHAMPSK